MELKLVYYVIHDTTSIMFHDIVLCATRGPQVPSESPLSPQDHLLILIRSSTPHFTKFISFVTYFSVLHFTV